MEYLDKMVRVKVTDGRVVEGLLRCVDKDMNLVLSQGIEYHGLESVDSAKGTDTLRNLGSVMIPGPHVCAVVCQMNETETGK